MTSTNDKTVRIHIVKKPTTLVRIRRSGGQVVQDCEVYIGRRINMGGWNLSASKWQNPYKPGVDGTIQEVLVLYEKHIRESGLINSLEELRGKELGCWCKFSPHRTSEDNNTYCHGEVLMKLLRTG